MKKQSIIFLSFLLASMIAFNTACENEELSPYVEPLPGIHAYAELADVTLPPGNSTPADFTYGDLDDEITYNIQWIFIDGALSVNRIELFVLFNEDYTDEDGNPLVAAHGGSEGILFQTIEGSEVPGNRENVSFSLTQLQIYDLYEGITFDYDDDDSTAPTPVFNNPEKPERQASTAPFISDDTFVVRWVLYTDNDLVFDSWSPSVCTELPGANCEVSWGVVELEE